MREIAAKFAISGPSLLEIRREKDCVAEGKGFEPSVQLISLQVVNVCVSYAGYRVDQRILYDCLLAGQSMRTSATLAGIERRSMVNTVADSGPFRSQLQLSTMSDK